MDSFQSQHFVFNPIPRTTLARAVTNVSHYLLIIPVLSLNVPAQRLPGNNPVHRGLDPYRSSVGE